MGKWLFLLFTVVPVVELWLLIRIGQLTSAWVSIALVLGMGFVGAVLAKREGLRVLREWQGTVSRGQVPEEGLTGAALVLVGGVLMVTPGVLTDVLGIALLIPPVRRWIAARVRRRIEKAVARGTVRVTHFGPPGGFGGGGFGGTGGGAGGGPGGGFGSRGGGEREVQGEATVRRPPRDGES